MKKVKKTTDEIVRIEKNLRRVCWKVKKKGRKILTSFNITPPQFTALQYLLDQDEMTIGELSKKMYLACSTVTDLLDRMEKNKLVKRVKDKNDRRIVRIKVEEKGHQLIKEVLKARYNYLENSLVDLDDAEIRDLDEYMKMLNDKFEL